jgi:plasmid maintenance system antidote protein VapI
MIVARFKQATGMSDRELAALLGVARSTVQAGLAGKLRLKISDDARTKLQGVIAERLALLATIDLTPRQDC